MDTFSFPATIEKMPDVGGWHFIRLPASTLADLRASSNKNGTIPILVTIGDSTWPTTIMSMGEQRWFFAVGADIRKDESLGEGDKVPVQVRVDRDRLAS